MPTPQAKAYIIAIAIASGSRVLSKKTHIGSVCADFIFWGMGFINDWVWVWWSSEDRQNHQFPPNFRTPGRAIFHDPSPYPAPLTWTWFETTAQVDPSGLSGTDFMIRCWRTTNAEELSLPNSSVQKWLTLKHLLNDQSETPVGFPVLRFDRR